MSLYASFIFSYFYNIVLLLTLANSPYFATFASGQGEGVQPPVVSKLSVIELSGKNQQIALDECSRD